MILNKYFYNNKIMKRKIIKLFDQTFDCVDTQKALTFIDYFIKQQSPMIICAKNVSLIVECSKNKFLREFYENVNLITVDGRPLVYISRIFLEEPFPEMVGGPNLWYRIIEFAYKRYYTIYFLGGTQSIVEKAVRNLKIKYPDIMVVGFINGYFKDLEIPLIINEIKQRRPDIIYLGLPTPKKEKLAQIISDEVRCGLIVLVGGIFDVFAGEKNLAPKFISKLCIEWLYRICQEPKRLWKRYLITNTIFILLVLKELFKKYSKKTIINQ